MKEDSVPLVISTCVKVTSMIEPFTVFVHINTGLI